MTCIQSSLSCYIFCMHSLIAYPGIVPRRVLVSLIECFLSWQDQKALSRVDMVLSIATSQHSASGTNEMDQEIISCLWSEKVFRQARFLPELADEQFFFPATLLKRIGISRHIFIPSATF